MTERERLDEILDKAPKSLRYEDLSDYLFENNVRTLPCKIGDVVYGILKGEIIPITIESIIYNKCGVQIVGSNEEHYGYGTISLDINNKIGMNWYYTIEEAEYALKEIINEYV